MSDQSLVVIADDDTITRSIVELKLKSRGYRVKAAVDGDEALRLIGSERPGLVVLDAMMPGRDGFEVLRQIKGTPDLAGIPVVMLTARKLEHDIVDALQTGASDYLVKPFLPEELAVRVARLLPARR